MRRLALATALALAPAPLLAQQAAAPLPLGSAELRQASVESLQATLYDLIALRAAAHQMHWNVIGIEFYQLHEVYETLYASLDGFIDDTGARIRALGAPVDGRSVAVAENSPVTPPPVEEIGGEESARLLLADYARVADRLRERIGATGDDLVTQDHLVAVTAAVEKDLWMLRAHVGGS
jgi:starvation-inducible DNA-binding protein